MYRVAFDSDGVIADFDALVYEILGQRHIHEVPKGTMWKEIERYDREVAPFFESLGIMPGVERMLDFAHQHFSEVFVLTASGYTPADGAAQKRRWYSRHFPHLRVEVVPKSPDKAAFATPTTILVDDRSKSIDPWVAAGGIGILHTSVEDTIAQLRAFVV
jgi:5'(3')-deoxyribonucleotidase